MVSTITGNPAAFSTIVAADDFSLNNRANRLITYQPIADEIAYLRAKIMAPTVYYVGSTANPQTQVDSLTGDSTWRPSTLLTKTIDNLPVGSIITVSAQVYSTPGSSLSGKVRLEKYENSTVYNDPNCVYHEMTTNVSNQYRLQGVFTKTYSGSITVRVSFSSSTTIYTYSPANMIITVYQNV